MNSEGRDIYVKNSEGSGPPTKLTKNPSNDSDPVFSPDCEKLAFTSDRCRELDIFIMSVDGSG